MADNDRPLKIEVSERTYGILLDRVQAESKTVDQIISEALELYRSKALGESPEGPQ